MILDDLREAAEQARRAPMLAKPAVVERLVDGLLAYLDTRESYVEELEGLLRALRGEADEMRGRIERLEGGE